MRVNWSIRTAMVPTAMFVSLGLAGPASADTPIYKGHRVTELLSSGGRAAWMARNPGPSAEFRAVLPLLVDDDPFLDPDAPLSGFPSLADEGGEPGVADGNGNNVFVNDPCLDPPPPSRRRTVQSETEIAVLNSRSSHGKKMVVGYNDSYGFYDNTQGLSGFAYSTDGGESWVDGGGLPPAVPSHSPLGPPGSDHYFGDPVLVGLKVLRQERKPLGAISLRIEGVGHARRAKPTWRMRVQHIGPAAKQCIDVK